MALEDEDPDVRDAAAEALQEEVEKARRYESRHDYSLAGMGLTREQIAVEYLDVIARFGFDAG